MELETGADDAGRRLDRILRKALPDYPLSLIHRLLRRGRVLVDGRQAAAGERMRSGAVISVPGITPVSRRPAPVRPSGSPALAILWQGAGLLILNKPAGLAVHGPGGLDGLARAYLAGSLPPSLSFRPGPLHRLDKPASGVIVFSTGLEGARYFSARLRERRIQKSYLALVEGRIETDEIWRDELIRDKSARKTFAKAAVLRHPPPQQKTPLARAQPGEVDAKSALTKVRPLAANAAYTLLLAEIETGRTHQIRAQAAAHGHPLAGDIKYGGHTFHGGGGRGGGFFLHAWNIELHETPPPERGTFPFPRSITAPPPAAFQERIRALFGESVWRFIASEQS